MIIQFTTGGIGDQLSKENFFVGVVFHSLSYVEPEREKSVLRALGFRTVNFLIGSRMELAETRMNGGRNNRRRKSGEKLEIFWRETYISRRMRIFCCTWLDDTHGGPETKPTGLMYEANTEPSYRWRRSLRPMAESRCRQDGRRCGGRRAGSFLLQKHQRRFLRVFLCIF